MRTKLMGLVKQGRVSIETAYSALKGSDNEILAIFAWDDCKQGFPTMLFQTYEWFTDAPTLLRKFIEQYPLACCEFLQMLSRFSINCASLYINNQAHFP